MTPSWLERQVAKGVVWLFGKAANTIGNAVVTRVPQARLLSTSPHTRLLTRLHLNAERTNVFAHTLAAADSIAWCDKTCGELLALDHTLSLGGTAEAALSRAELHAYITRNNLWHSMATASMAASRALSNRWGDAHGRSFLDRRSDEITAMLYSGYRQLLAQGESHVLQRRMAADYALFMSHRMHSLQEGYSHAAYYIMDTAQHYAPLFEGWDDARVAAYAEPFINIGKDLPRGRWDARMLNPQMLSRYVQIKARETGNLDEARRIFASIPDRMDYRSVRFAIFDGMVEAVRAGVPAPKAQWNDRAGFEFARLLSAENPWEALGRRMLTLRGDVREKCPIASFMNVEHVGRATDFLSDEKQNSLHAGINIGLKAVLRAKKSGAIAQVLTALRMLDGRVSVMNTETGLPINNFMPALPTIEKMPYPEKKRFIATIVGSAHIVFQRRKTMPWSCPGEDMLAARRKAQQAHVDKRIEPTLGTVETPARAAEQEQAPVAPAPHVQNTPRIARVGLPRYAQRAPAGLAA